MAAIEPRVNCATPENFLNEFLPGKKNKPSMTNETLTEYQIAENLDLHIGELNLSVRARKATTKLGVLTIRDLTRFSAKDLMALKNFGRTSLNEVREQLAERGCKLRGE